MRDGAMLFSRTCPPQAPSRGWVTLAHGVAEHSGRYEHVIQRLNESGFGVLTYDCREHGRSARQQPTAYVASFAELVEDATEMHARTTELAKGKPCFLFGHSMGALVVLHYLLRQPDVAGAVLSAIPLIPCDDVPRALWPVVQVASALLPRLGVRQINSRLISSDPKQVAKYDQDPLNFRGRLPVRTGHQILAAAHGVRSELQEIRAPLLVLHGTADRVADIEGSRDLVERASSADKRFVACDGLYHEILNEPVWPSLMDQITTWLIDHS